MICSNIYTAFCLNTKSTNTGRQRFYTTPNILALVQVQVVTGCQMYNRANFQVICYVFHLSYIFTFVGFKRFGPTNFQKYRDI